MPPEKINESLRDDPGIFTMHGDICFNETGIKHENNITLELYDGNIVPNDWFFGNLAIELSSIKLAKKKLPILFNHDDETRIGYSTNASTDGKFTMEGRLLDTPQVQAIRDEAKQGFPFEASFRFDPGRSKLVQVSAGQEAEVNGRTLKGPGTIIKNAFILEGSIVVFGRLTNTSSKIFKDNNFIKESDMATKESTITPAPAEMTLASFQADHQDLFAEVTRMGKEAGEKAGEKAALDRFAAISKLAADDPAFVVEQFAKSATLDAVKDALIAKQAQALTKQAEVLAKKAAETKSNTDPAHQEFSDEQKKHEAGKPGDQGVPNPGTEAAFKAEWDKNPELRTEFGDDDAGWKRFLAYSKAKAAGQVHERKS